MNINQLSLLQSKQYHCHLYLIVWKYKGILPHILNLMLFETDLIILWILNKKIFEIK